MAFGSIGTNILFAIHTSGASKSKAQWAMVGMAVLVVANALNKVRKSAQEFSQAYGKLTSDQRGFLREMEAANRGMVDTKASIEAIHTAAAAKLPVTTKLMKSITVLATDMAQKMGEGPEGATRRVKALTDAISKGQSRALKQYGIELEETENLLLAQQEAMEKVTRRADGLTVQIETLDESLYAAGNNIDTYIGLLGDWVSGVEATDGPLGSFNDAMSKTTDLIIETDGAVLDAVVSWDNLSETFLSMSAGLPGLIYYMTDLEDRVHGIVSEGIRLRNIELGKEIGLAASKTGMPASVFSIDQAAALDAPVAPGSIFDPDVEMRKAGKGKADNLLKPSARGGGGRRMRQAKSDLDLYLESLQKEDTLQDKINRGKEEYNNMLTEQALYSYDFTDTSPDLTAEIEMTSAASMNEIIGERLDLTKELADIEGELAIVRQDERMNALNQLHTDQQAEFDARHGYQELMWQGELDQAEREKILKQEKHDWLLSNSEDYRRAQQAINRAESFDRLSIMGQMFGGISSLMNTENRKLFAIGKAAALAGAVVNTASAAVKAYEVGMGAGFPVGLVLGPAMAASAVAAGSVQIATIAQTEFGGGAKGVNSSAKSAPGGGSFGGGGFGNNVSSGGGSGNTNQIIINIGDKTIHESLIDANEQAQKQGLKSFVQV